MNVTWKKWPYVSAIEIQSQLRAGQKRVQAPFSRDPRQWIEFQYNPAKNWTGGNPRKYECERDFCLGWNGNLSSSMVERLTRIQEICGSNSGWGKNFSLNICHKHVYLTGSAIPCWSFPRPPPDQPINLRSLLQMLLLSSGVSILVLVLVLVLGACELELDELVSVFGNDLSIVVSENVLIFTWNTQNIIKLVRELLQTVKLI